MVDSVSKREAENYVGRLSRRLHRLVIEDQSTPTKQEAQKALGISRGSMDGYLDGSRPPPMAKLYALAKLYNVTPEYLAFGIEQNKSDGGDKIVDIAMSVVHKVILSYGIDEDDARLIRDVSRRVVQLHRSDAITPEVSQTLIDHMLER